MTINEQRSQLIERIKKNFKDHIFSISIEQLVREDELGNHLNFKSGEQAFINIIDICKKVNYVDLNEIPYNSLINFNTQLEQAITLFSQIKSFNPTFNNPISQRDNLVTQAFTLYEACFSTASPILITSLINASENSIERNKLEKLITDIEIEKERINKEFEIYLKEIQSILEKARQAAVGVGVTQHNKIFKLESEEHEALSKTWLKRTVFVLISITTIGVASLFIKPLEESAPYLIHFSITKIIILSVMFYALAICSRNYKAHKHNAILNKHRQNALSTFETFAKSAESDQQTKNAVLLEATHTIFSNQQTGYLNNENESDSPNKIIEIIKNSNSNK